jgi:hypothetical protein
LARRRDLSSSEHIESKNRIWNQRIFVSKTR